MDQTDIILLAVALKQATEKSALREILAILHELKANVWPTEDMLRSTSVSRNILRLKRKPELGKQISGLAEQIISRWRYILWVQKLGRSHLYPTQPATPAQSRVRMDVISLEQDESWELEAPYDMRTWTVEQLKDLVKDATIEPEAEADTEVVL